MESSWIELVLEEVYSSLTERTLELKMILQKNEGFQISTLIQSIFSGDGDEDV